MLKLSAKCIVTLSDSGLGWRDWVFWTLRQLPASWRGFPWGAWGELKVPPWTDRGYPLEPRLGSHQFVASWGPRALPSSLFISAQPPGALQK